MRHPEKGLIVDLSSTINDDDKVRIIYNELLKVQDSGWIQGGEPVVFLMNRIAANAMTKLHRAWNNLLGVTVNKNEISNKVFTYPVIETPAGISMINAYCEHLSKIYPTEGRIIMFPKNALALYSRQNHRGVANGQNIVVQQAELTSKFEDVSDTRATECREYRIMLEYAQFVM
ncbi:MAG: hypothetical protein NZZ41_02775 [Candidatus Dojkabacteria bacterium]|nr:hypothetical protein [Candidatus Dojkabacteria bacterium]